MRYRWLLLLGIGLLASCTAQLPWAATPTVPPTPTATTAPLALATPTFLPSPTAQPSLAPTPTLELAQATPTATTPMSPAERLALFNDVWQTVNEHYLYPDFNGVDWAAVRTEIEPQVQAAPDDETLYTILEGMVAKLNDQHSRFARPVEAVYEDAVASGTDSYVGIGVLTIHEENAAFITLVFPDSPAQAAGLMRGDRITAVEGQPFTNADQIRGPEGSQVRLTIQTPQADPRELLITRRAVVGKITPSGRRLPNAPTVGYVLIPSLWADDMHTQVVSELSKLIADPQPLDGLILDLRSNGGGWRSVLEGILGQFVSGEVGNFYSQEKLYPLNVKPGLLYEQLKQVPLAVLIDKDSASYAEVLAGTLQFNGALVLGQASQGNTETIFQYNFEDGSRLWVAQEGFKLPDGSNFETKGVQPNIVVEDDWTQYTIPNDPAVLQAIVSFSER
ncbi:MAG: PDZ domain-containing protein [Chloroflexi bacterium]|nr:PDZ domain-containing protein [Chloroflexota bacterium]